MRADPSGEFWWIIPALVIPILLTGCSSESDSPREDLADAPDLDVSTAAPSTYNCYGNAIGKQIVTNPTGYQKGDSTQKTFEAVINDLGKDNVRRLNSINDPIGDDEFMVALKCGPSDYHFIRLDGNHWYNKSGTAPGLYIDQSLVVADTWFAIWMNNGQAYMGDPRYGYPYYDDETIFFAIKAGWDTK